LNSKQFSLLATATYTHVDVQLLMKPSQQRDGFRLGWLEAIFGSDACYARLAKVLPKSP
jgi:hypothetical protein